MVIQIYVLKNLTLQRENHLEHVTSALLQNLGLLSTLAAKTGENV